MKRREFITLLGGAAIVWPLAARARQPMPVVGYFSTRSPDAEAPLRVPFLKALEGSGFTAGRNVTIEYRFAEGQHERLPVLAADLVRRRSSRLSCGKVGKAQIFTTAREASGESRFKAVIPLTVSTFRL